MLLGDVDERLVPLPAANAGAAAARLQQLLRRTEVLNASAVVARGWDVAAPEDAPGGRKAVIIIVIIVIIVLRINDSDNSINSNSNTL